MYQKSLLKILVFFTLGTLSLKAQNTSNHGNKFEQLETILPSPNEYRGIDGAPGPKYWQQKCDYDIVCTLDVDKQQLHGEELITYYNQSPHTLRYLWLQLDENEHNAKTDKHYFEPSSMEDKMSGGDLRMLEPWRELEKYGHNIEAVTTKSGQPLKYTINMTMMRVDLPKPLKPGEQFSFQIKWNYYLIDRMNSTSWGRGGYEYFEKDGNYLFTIVQWFPRLCLYSDNQGWQNNQFTGRGEFALTFGNYKVKMTVPSDYMVGSTGTCQNYEAVLTPTQMARYKQAQKVSEPLEIVTLAEAKAMEKAAKSKKLQTWEFHAENVRDFAWTASRKFIWDAMPFVTEENKTVMCMSYYPKESYPIYNRYSTKAVAHTLKTYSKYSIPYPYPVAISVEAKNGMEYPMICFNPGRAEEDGTYTAQAKKVALTVIIHEVGHNYFPMIINSDERQWAWMDEGLNTFLQVIAEQEFDNNFPTSDGLPHLMPNYMRMDKDELEPIMTNTENIIHYGYNAYDKPAAGLMMLRETIMGRELFDYAFKEYCRRWAFKHPTPADFFRTMEDASGVDLDWFWRGWFYGIDPVDISLDSVKWYKPDLKNDPKSKELTQTKNFPKPFEHYTKKQNRKLGIEFAVEKDKDLNDFYSTYKPWETKDSVQERTFILYGEKYSKKEKKKLFKDKNYYELHFSNKGGCVMPVLIEWTFKDGSKEMQRIPVEIWRKNENQFTKVFVKDKEVTAIRIDPNKETADIDEENNNWPVRQLPTRFEVFKKHIKKKHLNPMQKAQGKTIKP